MKKDQTLFISHSGRDAEYARRLAEVLGRVGVSSWLNAELSPGQDILSAVRSAIERSAAHIFLVSPDSINSPWILFELGAAMARGLPIFPVIIRGEGIDLPEPLRNFQILDARGRPAEDVAEELEKAIPEAAVA